MAEVVFVADQVHPLRGMEKALLDLLTALGDRVDAQVITLTGPMPSGFPCHVESLGMPTSPARLIWSAWRLRRSLQATRCHTVVAVGVWAAVPTLLAVRRRRARVLLWEHSVLPWRLSNVKSMLLVAHAVYRLLGRRIAAVIAVSAAVERAVCRLTRGQVPVQVVPNLVIDLGEPRQIRPPSGGRLRLLGVGGLVGLKNWALAIKSLAYLPLEYSLDIAGDGQDRGRLEMLIADLGLSGRVRLLGHRDDVPHLLQACDVVVHPSYVETFGYSLIEASAAGKPVVCIDMPVMNEVVPQPVPGVIVKQDSPKFFAEGIKEAVTLASAGAFPAPGKLDNRTVVLSAWVDGLGVVAN